MAKFYRLTAAIGGDPVWINPEHVHSIRPGQAMVPGTLVQWGTGEGGSILVKEKAEEVVKTLNGSFIKEP